MLISLSSAIHFQGFIGLPLPHGDFCRLVPLSKEAGATDHLATRADERALRTASHRGRMSGRYGPPRNAGG